MNRILQVSAVIAVLCLDPAFGQEVEELELEPEAEPVRRKVEIPGAELTPIMGDGKLELDGSDGEDSWIKRFAQKWPADLVVAPIPGRSPQLGWTLALGAGYFIQTKSAEPDHHPSILGGFGMWAENGSYAYGLGGNFHLMGDRLRLKVGAGYGDITYRYYGRGFVNDLGFNVDIRQELPLYFAQGMYNVWDRLYVGLGYLGGEVTTSLAFSRQDPFFDPSLKLDLGAWSVPIEWDARDHEQFPRDGWFVQGRASWYREGVGSDFEADIYKLAINNYFPMRDTDVLATRLYLRAASDDSPFFLLSQFGGSKDLRGYPSGRYRDPMMYAIQTEYRWQFNNKWIFTGFVGVGEVGEDFGDFGDDFLPAAGLGTRFVLSQKHKVGLSFDVAQGKHGIEYYFGIGEAF